MGVDSVVPPAEQWNVGWLCTGAHVAAGRGGKVALRWLPATGPATDQTFADLDADSSRFANVLARLGCDAGATVFVWLPKSPELFAVFLGALKHRAVVGTVFASLGADSLLRRLENARPEVLVTRRSYLKKLRATLPDGAPWPRHVLVADDGPPGDGAGSLSTLMREASPAYEVAATDPETPSVLHYTSGSTGMPKGVLHVHGAVRSQRATAEEVLGLRPDDVFWCTADPGWVTGTSYGIVGPWSLAVRQIHHGCSFDAEAWFRILERERVTVWYTAPTALRMLMREPEERLRRFDLSALRAVFSVGEPLGPEVIRWAERTLGRPVHDTWFQTETGAIAIANRPGVELRPGSMGKPVAGVRAAILAEDGTEAPAGTVGHLCLEAGWSSMFRTYLGDPEAYRARFHGGFYRTGDEARVDADGHFWFVGRSDDVINTAGHLVSPFEVESALLELPAVVESAVVGVPDPLLHERVVAFVHLREPGVLTRELELELRLHVSKRVSTTATPQEVVAVPRIPKNRAGKILRRVLRARHTGGDPGDLSTLDDEP